MLTLGLDISLRSTGVALTGDFGHRTWVIAPSPGDPITQRLGTLRDGLLAILADSLPGLAIIERGFTAPIKGMTAGPSATKLGQAQGALMVALWDLAIPVELVSPTTVKKWATGRGNASKEMVLQAAVAQLGFIPTTTGRKKDMHSDYDRADALWLADFGARGASA